jgi:hypothetical protein
MASNLQRFGNSLKDAFSKVGNAYSEGRSERERIF